MPPKDGIALPVYMTLLKIERQKAKEAFKGLEALPEKHNPNLKIWYVANIFGEWDNCVWFEAEKPEYAMEFVQDFITKIPGVVHTYTLPTTPIKKYWKPWK